MQITTATGFTCEIKDKAFEDYRVARSLAKLEAAGEGRGDEGEALVAAFDLFSRILGDEQEEALICHVEQRSPDGIATFPEMYAELGSIMTALKESKKKIPSVRPHAGDR